MLTKIKQLLIKYRELIMYAIFGILTTAVDFGSYFVMTRYLSLNEHFSNILAQALAIVFAFFTNKKYVFKDDSRGKKAYAEKFIKFVSLRLLTMLLNSVIFSLVIETAVVNDILVKVLVAIIIVILNYIFSKLVFKKKGATK